MSQINFLDENGLLYLWQRLKTIFATENDLAAIESTVSGLVAAGGQANVIETIQVNGAAQSVTNKTVNIIVPTNNSQLANGAGYQTAAQVTSEIDEAIAGVSQFNFEVVQTLPATGTTGTIYLVPITGRTNAYNEYIYVGGSWEQIGTTDIDLSGYVQATDLVPIANAEIDTILAS